MFNINSGARPWGLRFRSSKQFILATVMFAVFTDTFLYSLIIPVVPYSLESRVGVASDDVGKWVSVLIAVYGAAIVVMSPFIGWFADHSKTRSLPLIGGLLFLAGCTIMLHLSRTIPLLIVARILQGASASVVWIVGLALLPDTVDESEVGQYMGNAFAATSIGVLVGPLVGGIVFARVNYNIVFVVAYVIIGIDILLRLLLIEKKTARRWQDESESEEAHAQSETETRISTEPETEVETKAETETGAEIRRSSEPPATPGSDDSHTSQAQLEKPKSRSPAILILLKSMRLLSALYGIVIGALLITAFEAVLTLHVKEIWGWTSEGAALLFLPMLLPSLLGGVIGWLTDKFGARWIVTAGFLLDVPALVCLRFVETNTIGQKILCCALLAIFGFCINMNFVPLSTDITYVVQIKAVKHPHAFDKHGAYAQAYGLLNVAYAAGTLLGPLWGGFINTSAGWATMTWTLGLLSGVSAIPSLIWCGGAIYRERSTALK